MKTVLGLTLVAVLMMGAAPAFAAEATQMWKCEMEDETTEAEVNAMAKEWLKIARTVEGGEQLEATVYFPVAVDATGEVDFLFAVVAPTMEQWGRFWDNYADSPLGEADELSHDKFICPDSAVWESVAVTVE